MRFEKENGSFAAALKALEIGTGDLLTVSSDIKTLLFRMSTEYNVRGRSERNAALNELIDTLQAAVGTEGTLLFPVFSWDWCRGKGFDLRTTKGEVGTLQNWVLENRPDFLRTRHPMYSFMVWGKDAGILAAMDNQDAWGPASPFRYLHTHGGKNLLFNVESYQALTFCHYVEQEVRVPYRHPKYLAENKAAKKTLWEENILTAVDLPASYPVIRDDILNNRGRNTLTFAGREPDLDAPQTIPFEVKGIEG